MIKNMRGCGSINITGIMRLTNHEHRAQTSGLRFRYVFKTRLLNTTVLAGQSDKYVFPRALAHLRGSYLIKVQRNVLHFLNYHTLARS